MSDTPLAGTMLRMALTLGAIVALLLLAAWCARRFGLGGAARRDPADAVRVVSRTALDARKSVFVLSFRGRLLVVGATPTEIRLLTEVPGGEAAPLETGEPSFSTRLARVLSEQGSLRDAH
jgi:flagellar biosynthetic protein FliO